MIKFTQGGDMMKIRYPIMGIIILFISATIWEYILGPDTFEQIGHPILVILLLSLLGLIAYLIAKLVFNEIGKLMDDVQHSVQRRSRHKEQQSSQMEQINQELDEIEATLNALAEAENSDGKITPIWNAKPPKR